MVSSARKEDPFALAVRVPTYCWLPQQGPKWRSTFDCIVPCPCLSPGLACYWCDVGQQRMCSFTSWQDTDFVPCPYISRCSAAIPEAGRGSTVFKAHSQYSYMSSDSWCHEWGQPSNGGTKWRCLQWEGSKPDCRSKQWHVPKSRDRWNQAIANKPAMLPCCNPISYWLCRWHAWIERSQKSILFLSTDMSVTSALKLTSLLQAVSRVRSVLNTWGTVLQPLLSMLDCCSHVWPVKFCNFVKSVCSPRSRMNVACWLYHSCSSKILRQYESNQLVQNCGLSRSLLFDCTFTCECWIKQVVM